MRCRFGRRSCVRLVLEAGFLVGSLLILALLVSAFAARERQFVSGSKATSATTRVPRQGLSDGTEPLSPKEGLPKKTEPLSPTEGLPRQTAPLSPGRGLPRQMEESAFPWMLAGAAPVRHLPFSQQKRILVTGGAGFVGSHLVDLLMEQGHAVMVMDNFYTGSRRNVRHWMGHPNFELLHHDVEVPLQLEVDQIYHLASPASPPHYMADPVKTLTTNFLGTLNMLQLAKRTGARFLLASTSEVYGDPLEHPQREDYWGHVNPNGPRACYDEGKRSAEALTYDFQRRDGLEVRVARIFNTFGPRMHLEDGRVVSNFLRAALEGKPMTVYGSGAHTRSFQYVSDLVEGLEMLMNSNYSRPVNLGNPEEHTVLEFAHMVRELLASASEIVHLPPSKDDPQRRRPDISLAKERIGWQPRVPMLEGVRRTMEYFKRELQFQKFGTPFFFAPEIHEPQ